MNKAIFNYKISDTSEDIVMSDFVFLWDTMSVAKLIVTLVAFCIVYAFLFFMYAKIVKRKTGYVFISITFVLNLAFLLLNLIYVFLVSAILTGVGVTITLFTNLGDLRQFLANPFRASRVKTSKAEVEKIYNRELLYKTIERTVISLSKTRTGAIITFEKSTSLQDVIKNGVPVRAPVSAELLQTIFYPGTRLHDGAVVIHGNEIVAASVFYTPTTKPFAGKYGSRHRAALGISEISDSVTVVVSEETGRISFAVNGQLDAVDQGSFLRVFENYMDGVNEE